MAGRYFFDSIRRPLFRGRLKQSQVDGLAHIVEYGLTHGYSRFQLAYILATAHHETGRRMQPIREGFCKTDRGSRRAVANLHSKGIIRTNYALPDGPYGHSYYGRGLVQITWLKNYAKMGKVIGVDLVKDPDKTLEWDVALPLLFIGHVRGLYTGKKLPRTGEFTAALRAIINGDVKRNGAKVAQYAKHYYAALEVEYGKKR